MKNNYSISADINKAIETLSEKLGIASNTIIPEYAKTIRVGAISEFFAGIIVSILPWLIAANFGSYIKYILCSLTTIIGIILIFGSPEGIFAPTGKAIEKLLDTLKKSN